MPVNAVEETFRALTGYEPYDYQRRAWERILEVMESGKTVTIEVPTAGGKTEAATMPFIHQVISGDWLVSRLIYVLPTRSLVRRQARRLERYMRRASDLSGRASSGDSVRVEMGMEPTFLFLGDLIVSTWDAFLYGLAAHRTLGTRFTFPAGAIAESMVVFDEVQMYQDEEMYMPSLMGLVVERLREARIPTVVMTATMPPQLKGVLGITGYPTVEVSESDERKPERGDVSIELVEADLGEEDLIDRVSRAVEMGGKALIVRNTVSRAVETYRQLSDEFEGIMLLHSRLTVGDREDRERSLDDARIIVATQVVEAGLDMPSVLELVTDLAPLDALIQRVGRCARRHGEEGRATIVLPDFDKSVADEEVSALGIVDLEMGFASPRAEVGRLGVPGVEIEVGGEIKHLIDLLSYRRLRRRRSRGDVLVLPFASTPYDPLIMLRTFKQVSRMDQSFLRDSDAVRDALSYVYDLHYGNNISSRHLHDAYIYFRYLRLFSAPPEVELRSRPQLYSIIQLVEDDRLEEGELIDLEPEKMIRVDYRWLQRRAEDLGIKFVVRSEYDASERKIVHRLDRLVGRPIPFTIHALGFSHYNSELGLLAGGGD